MESNFLKWLCQKYSREKYLSSKKSKSVIALNSIFKPNTSNIDPSVKQKKQTWTSEEVAGLLIFLAKDGLAVQKIRQM